MNGKLVGRRSFLRRAGAVLAGLGAGLSGFSLHRVLAQQDQSYCAETQAKIQDEWNTFNPVQVFKTPVCLYLLSKNLNGKISNEPQGKQQCKSPQTGDECVTQQTIETLEMKVETNKACDSDVSIKFLDGDFFATLATTYFQDGNQRGYHTGTFKWGGPGGTILGRMSGITNAGTHRDPLRENCETCDTRLHMEGRLDGFIEEGDLKGCCVFASYAIDFPDTTLNGATGAAQAVFEGVVMCDCQT